MKLAVMLAVAAAAAISASAQEPLEVKLWDNATAPHSNAITQPEQTGEGKRISHTTEAVLYIYRPAEGQATGQAVVVCPGGGYWLVAMSHEGDDVGRWFAQHGITAAVLKYRMPNGHPEVPLEDVEQALRIMMGLEAGATGFTAGKVGIVGSSAGGHLAASASTLAETKPAFSILFYPVITAEKGKGHQGSFNALLGGSRNAESDTWYSLQNRVTAQTPPTLLLLSDDDKVVPPVNGILYYNALKEHGVKASMHIYPTGGHGWGIRDRFKYKEQWQQATLDWLKELNDDRNTASVLLRQPGLPGCVDVGIRPATSRKSAGRELAEAVVQAAVQEFGQQVRSRRESDWPAGQ